MLHELFAYNKENFVKALKGVRTIYAEIGVHVSALKNHFNVFAYLGLLAKNVIDVQNVMINHAYTLLAVLIL